MQLDFWEVLTNLAGLFLLIAVGYGAVKLDIVPRSASAALSQLLLKITLPCTVFTSLLRPYDPSFLFDILLVFALGLVLLPINALISQPLATIANVPKNRRGVWTFCSTFGNTGFMGFPIALALFGEEGLALATVFNMSFNIHNYGLGALMIASDRPKDSGAPLIRLRSVLITSINVGATLGLLCYFAQISVPTIILTPLTHLGNVTTPMSMFVTGMNLTGKKFSAIFRDRDVLTASFARLVIMPLVFLGELTLLNLVLPFNNPIIFGLLFVVMAMPAAGAGTILAENYGVNPEFPASVIFLTSLFCIATIPIMTMFL